MYSMDPLTSLISLGGPPDEGANFSYKNVKNLSSNFPRLITVNEKSLIRNKNPEKKGRKNSAGGKQTRISISGSSASRKLLKKSSTSSEIYSSISSTFTSSSENASGKDRNLNSTVRQKRSPENNRRSRTIFPYVVFLKDHLYIGEKQLAFFDGISSSSYEHRRVNHHGYRTNFNELKDSLGILPPPSPITVEGKNYPEIVQTLPKEDQSQKSSYSSNTIVIESGINNNVQGSRVPILEIENSNKKHLRHHRGKHKKVGTSVLGVEGAPSVLPCDVTSKVPNDAPLLLMWFKEGSHTPLFSVDFGAKNSEPNIGRDKESGLTQRGTLHVNVANEFYEGHFLRTTNHSSSTQMPFKATGGNLEIHPTKRNDEGIYKCRVDFLHSPTRNEKVNLTVLIPPHTLEVEWNKDGEWVQPSGEFLEPLIVGDPLRIVCKAAPSWPPPLVIWSSKGIKIDDSFEQHPEMSLPTKVLKSNKILTGAVNQLQINELQRSDHLRKLTCKSWNTNLVPPTSTTIVLSVALPVISVEVDDPPTRNEGELLEVQCTVKGSHPPPVVKWTLDDEELEASKFWVSKDGNVTASVVKLAPNSNKNGHWLTCLAYNPILHAHNIDDTKKDAKKLDILFAPSVTAHLGKSLNGSIIKEGDDVYFDCNVRANPKPHILYFMHNGEKLQTRSGLFLTANTLVIRGLSVTDSGNYSCFAANTKGQDESGEVALHVKFAPTCDNETSSKSYSIAKYEQAMIFCNVSANPPDVAFRWSFNNTAELVDVPVDRYSTDKTTSVLNYTPMNELDYGTLLCWGSNEVGKQDKPCVFHIKAAGKPEPPHNCKVIQATISSLRITCLPGSDGGDSQIFHLQVQKVTPSKEIVAEVSNSSADFFAANLQPSVKYRLLITAANKRGESHPPKQLLAKTAELQSQRHETNAEATRKRKTDKEDKIRVMMGISVAGTIAAIVILTTTIYACIRVRRRRILQSADASIELDKTVSEGTEEENVGIEGLGSTTALKTTDSTNKVQTKIVLQGLQSKMATEIGNKLTGTTSESLRRNKTSGVTIVQNETSIIDESKTILRDTDDSDDEDDIMSTNYQYSHRIFKEP